MSNSRDIGLNHSPGKGDKPRTKFDSNWAKRYNAIDWGRPKIKRKPRRI